MLVVFGAVAHLEVGDQPGDGIFLADVPVRRREKVREGGVLEAAEEAVPAILGKGREGERR